LPDPVAVGKSRSPMETIWLQKPSGDIPWGFRLQGGREFGQPLTVQRVTPGSIAANGRLDPGDIILKIGNVNATGITHNEAQDVIRGATNILQLTIRKGTMSTVSAPVSPTISTQYSNQPPPSPPPYRSPSPLADTFTIRNRVHISRRNQTVASLTTFRTIQSVTHTETNTTTRK
ncbi:hypothetical protein ACJMK2_034456, partial [Sinanodonta woodiana]